MEYEAVIGLEVHVQLKTRTKMFTRVPYAFAQEPNTLTDPVVLALPGALPVMNKEAIRKSIKTGLIFDCEIPELCKWDRKNYFYPDSPKAYQISQYDQPICVGGKVEIELASDSRNKMGEHRLVQLTRIHLEEDVGKLTHGEGDSLVDYNRAGCPLIEIVSEPDMHSSAECVAYLNAIRMNLVAAGISDCDMEKGQMRCDANISVREKGSSVLNNRTEMKNLNSISAVKAAVDYEIRRQTREYERGRTVAQETRRWDLETGKTYSMRSKEDAHDYRYFPDPDLMPVKVEREQLETLRAELPERPFDKERRFMEAYGLPYTITSVLCPVREYGEFFEEALKTHNNPQGVANLVANDLLRELSNAGEYGEGAMPLSDSKVTPQHIGELVKLTDEGVISKQMAKELFPEMFETGEMPAAMVERKGLKQSTDTGEIEGICRQVIEENPKPAQQFRDGNDKAINALKGRVMKATQGKANPQVVDELMRKLLAE